MGSYLYIQKKKTVFVHLPEDASVGYETAIFDYFSKPFYGDLDKREKAACKRAEKLPRHKYAIHGKVENGALVLENVHGDYMDDYACDTKTVGYLLREDGKWMVYSREEMMKQCKHTKIRKTTVIRNGESIEGISCTVCDSNFMKIS